jgi:hypothetical protein
MLATKTIEGTLREILMGDVRRLTGYAKLSVWGDFSVQQFASQPQDFASCAPLP